MVGFSLVMFGWSWTEVGVLGSQVFGQALVESCVGGGSVINGATPSCFQPNECEAPLKSLKKYYENKFLLNHLIGVNF